MRIMSLSEKIMGMDEEVWLRHASPLSVWSRVVTPLPLLSLALWSRVWLGWWALVPLFAVLVWIWWNPRAFAAPQNFESWASRGVLGERVWLRHADKIAPHHHTPARTLLALSGLGALPWIWGIYTLDFWAVFAGIMVITLSKMWFVDRCAWIWDDWRAAGRNIADLRG